MWRGDVDDRCLYCNGFLEPKRFSREVEKKISKELLKEADYLFINPTDSLVQKTYKRFFNWLRWWAFYVQIAFFAFISLLLVLLSLMAA
jgi:ABC-type multidrug transport system permease subunit